MPQTTFGINSPQAVRRYAGALFGSTMAKTFIARNMMEDAQALGENGDMANAPFVVINDLSKGAGDRVSFDLYIQLTGQPTFGDDILENNLEQLSAYTDEIIINQIRHGASAGGKMTQKRVLTNLRITCKNKLEEYLAAYYDQSGITTVSGGRGVSTQLLIPAGATAAIADASPYNSYDANHIKYGGSATSKGSLTTADKMSLDVVDRVITKINSEGGGADGAVKVAPLNKGGEDAYLLLMSPRQEHDIRKNTNTGDWLDIQKAAATANGNNSPLFKNTLGAYRGIHFRMHQHAVQFNDYGVGQNVRADRAVLMGRQACAVAFGNASSKGLRASWEEQTKDFGNQLEIGAGMVYSFKLPMFNSQVVNSYAIDTAVTTNL